MFILSIVLLLVALIIFLVAKFAKFKDYRDEVNPKFNNFLKRISYVFSGLAVIALLVSSIYSQSVGQAKVIINLGGTISHTDTTSGFGIKAPWQTASNWDLFSQEAVYAGNRDEGAPEYTGGKINGYEITSSVKGGAATNLDLQLVYNLNGENVESLYREFRDQERFTRQIVEPQILAAVRQVPPAYEPVEFRGEARSEATDRILKSLNERLGRYGITVTQVGLQNIRYTEAVEESIKSVEVAQQREAEAEANLRATEVSAQAQIVEAEARATAAIAEATGQAEANRLLSESLTPEILTQRYLDAISNGTTFVVPEGSTPLITTTAPPVTVE